MTVTELIAEVERRVPPQAPPGTRHTAEAWVGTGARPQQVRVAARIDPQGRRRETCLLDGIRVARSELLRLTCPQQDCPHARGVRQQWQAFHRRRAGLPDMAPADLDQRDGRGVARTEPSKDAAAVHHFSVAGQLYEAVASHFRCVLRCPHDAHGPMQLDLPGYDLYEKGRYLAGGLVHQGDQSRPRLPTPQAAEAYVLARQLEAQAWIATTAQGGRDALDR